MRERDSSPLFDRGKNRIEDHIAEVSPAFERRMTRLTDSIALLKQSALAGAGELAAASCRSGAGDAPRTFTFGASFEKDTDTADAASSAASAAALLRGASGKHVSSPSSRRSKRQGSCPVYFGNEGSPGKYQGLFGEELSPSHEPSSSSSPRKVQRGVSSSPTSSPLRPPGTWDIGRGDMYATTLKKASGRNEAALKDSIPDSCATRKTSRSASASASTCASAPGSAPGSATTSQRTTPEHGGALHEPPDSFADLSAIGIDLQHPGDAHDLSFGAPLSISVSPDLGNLHASAGVTDHSRPHPIETDCELSPVFGSVPNQGALSTLAETRRRRAAGRELQEELRSENAKVAMIEEQLEEQRCAIESFRDSEEEQALKCIAEIRSFEQAVVVEQCEAELLEQKMCECREKIREAEAANASVVEEQQASQRELNNELDEARQATQAIRAKLSRSSALSSDASDAATIPRISSPTSSPKRTTLHSTPLRASAQLSPVRPLREECVDNVSAELPQEIAALNLRLKELSSSKERALADGAKLRADLDIERGRLSEASLKTEALEGRLSTISGETESLRDALEAKRSESEAQASIDLATEERLRSELREASTELRTKEAHLSGREAKLAEQTQQLEGLQREVQDRDERILEHSLALAKFRDCQANRHTLGDTLAACSNVKTLEDRLRQVRSATSESHSSTRKLESEIASLHESWVNEINQNENASQEALVHGDLLTQAQESLEEMVFQRASLETQIAERNAVLLEREQDQCRLAPATHELNQELRRLREQAKIEALASSAANEAMTSELAEVKHWYAGAVARIQPCFTEMSEAQTDLETREFAARVAMDERHLPWLELLALPLDLRGAEAHIRVLDAVRALVCQCQEVASDNQRLSCRTESGARQGIACCNQVAQSAIADAARARLLKETKDLQRALTQQDEEHDQLLKETQSLRRDHLALEHTILSEARSETEHLEKEAALLLRRRGDGQAALLPPASATSSRRDGHQSCPVPGGPAPLRQAARHLAQSGCSADDASQDFNQQPSQFAFKVNAPAAASASKCEEIPLPQAYRGLPSIPEELAEDVVSPPPPRDPDTVADTEHALDSGGEGPLVTEDHGSASSSSAGCVISRSSSGEEKVSSGAGARAVEARMKQHSPGLANALEQLRLAKQAYHAVCTGEVLADANSR